MNMTAYEILKEFYNHYKNVVYPEKNWVEWQDSHDYGSVEMIVAAMESYSASLSSEVERLRGLLREFVMRANYAFPETEQDLKWFEAGVDYKTEEGRNFMESIFICIGLGKDVIAPQEFEAAKKRFEKNMEDHNKMKSVRYPLGK